MEIFKNEAGVNISVEELMKLYEYDFFEELVNLIVLLDATQVEEIDESLMISDLLSRLESEPGLSG